MSKYDIIVDYPWMWYDATASKEDRAIIGVLVRYICDDLPHMLADIYRAWLEDNTYIGDCPKQYFASILEIITESNWNYIYEIDELAKYGLEDNELSEMFKLDDHYVLYDPHHELLDVDITYLMMDYYNPHYIHNKFFTIITQFIERLIYQFVTFASNYPDLLRQAAAQYCIFSIPNPYNIVIRFTGQ